MSKYEIPRIKEGGVVAQVCAIYQDDDKLSDPLYLRCR